VAEALKAKRPRKAKTRVNEKCLKMSRKQLENFLKQEKRFTLGSSITKFVIEGTPMQATKKGGNSNGNSPSKGWRGPKRKEPQSGRPRRN
jgi:hypothetical protein